MRKLMTATCTTKMLSLRLCCNPKHKSMRYWGVSLWRWKYYGQSNDISTPPPPSWFGDTLPVLEPPSQHHDIDTVSFTPNIQLSIHSDSIAIKKHEDIIPESWYVPSTSSSAHCTPQISDALYRKVPSHDIKSSWKQCRIIKFSAILWCGVVWRGVVWWCGVVRCGVVWCWHWRH